MFSIPFCAEYATDKNITDTQYGRTIFTKPSTKLRLAALNNWLQKRFDAEIYTKNLTWIKKNQYYQTSRCRWRHWKSYLFQAPLGKNIINSNDKTESWLGIYVSPLLYNAGSGGGQKQILLASILKKLNMSFLSTIQWKPGFSHQADARTKKLLLVLRNYRRL